MRSKDVLSQFTIYMYSLRKSQYLSFFIRQSRDSIVLFGLDAKQSFKVVDASSSLDDSYFF